MIFFSIICFCLFACKFFDNITSITMYGECKLKQSVECKDVFIRKGKVGGGGDLSISHHRHEFDTILFINIYGHNEPLRGA